MNFFIVIIIKQKKTDLKNKTKQNWDGFRTTLSRCLGVAQPPRNRLGVAQPPRTPGGHLATNPVPRCPRMARPILSFLFLFYFVLLLFLS
jgi:hypothetical protein